MRLQLSTTMRKQLVPVMPFYVNEKYIKNTNIYNDIKEYKYIYNKWIVSTVEACQSLPSCSYFGIHQSHP